MKLGPTGKFPEGKVSKDDEGELSFAVGKDGGNVVVNFGAPVVWFSMPPHLARKFAASLIEFADKASQ